MARESTTVLVQVNHFFSTEIMIDWMFTNHQNFVAKITLLWLWSITLYVPLARQQMKKHRGVDPSYCLMRTFKTPWPIYQSSVKFVSLVKTVKIHEGHVHGKLHLRDWRVIYGHYLPIEMVCWVGSKVTLAEIQSGFESRSITNFPRWDRSCMDNSSWPRPNISCCRKRGCVPNPTKRQLRKRSVLQPGAR